VPWPRWPGASAVMVVCHDDGSAQVS
jgi:hypothetical protein